MKLHKPFTLKEIAGLVKARFAGDADQPVTGINEIHMVESGDITFVDFEKYYDKALSSAATTIIINREVEVPAGKSLIFSDDPFRDYNFLTRYFQPQAKPAPDKFIIGDDSRVGVGTQVFPGAVIGNHVRIGKNCIIYPNVVIYDHALIGDNVIIHAGTVIGGDAFYYKRRPDHYDKMNSCGRAVLEDFVEIGANCTIDRGVSGDTIIGSGTKIDNMVHIGHDTRVGKNCIFASQVGIAGVTVIEDNVILWGQVGVTKDIVIGKGAVVSAKSGVSKSLEGGKSYFGTPAKEFRQAMKELAMIAKLPEIHKEEKKGN
jgi:UDP-3-O-[3-hydroxymyristoyl] glucosamine N-acyltransferase